MYWCARFAFSLIDIDSRMTCGMPRPQVGQMVIVQRSNGVYKYGLVSNFEDDEEGKTPFDLGIRFQRFFRYQIKIHDTVLNFSHP